nr:putative reverse transcriptase domain-containing protein [Tanacetum cinerariifolium]
MDEAHTTRYSVHPGADKMYYDLRDLYWAPGMKRDIAERRKPLEFKVEDRVPLKVSPWKGVVRFSNKGKLVSRFVGPFKIVEHVGPITYCLRLPQELSCVHDVFHVSNLKKCLAESDVQVKKLKHSWIPIVKVRWDSRRGAKFTWE